ncbi:hypothetical protein B0A49_02329 [Cryomyces minteri]|uniref:AB hydrolase-1 domain-containing protein n=1 Tax=Cryomyces minteri TaxID=331657 RepID=A0A4U0XM94_9PEZI|nr:hypothetical protein B0A49_02329 [Cryomyces minteri]
MASFAFLTLSLLSGQALAKVCTNVTIPVNINAHQPQFNLAPLQVNQDATRFALNFTNIGRNFTNEIFAGNFADVRGVYNISAKYCTPDVQKANPTVQFLTHGIGFDKSYWDLPFNNYNYSYIDVATAAGFSTVSIDRFGIGNSSKADPLNVVQAPAEVSAMYEITNMLRNGTFPTVAHKFQKVVHVGHSFGSAQTNMLVTLHPQASDGIVLTGWSINGTWLGQTLADWNLHLARLNQPLRFGNVSLAAKRGQNGQNKYKGQNGQNGHRNEDGSVNGYVSNSDLIQTIENALGLLGVEASASDIWQEIATTEVGDIINGWNETLAPPQNLPTGYLTWSDLTANIFAFLYPGFFEDAISLFAEKTKQPVTLGEILTLAGPIAPNKFAGPVQVVTGRQDQIYCGGDCLATGTQLPSIPAAAQVLFPNASAFQAYIHPNTGHGLNFHYNATGAYHVIQQWFQSHNLGSS